MPHYFIDTFDSIAVLDDVGQEVPDENALRKLVRTVLGEMILDEKRGRPSVQFRADVRDEVGNAVLTATLLMVIDKAPTLT